MAEHKDEIDEIMNEIASLQKEMAEVPVEASAAPQEPDETPDAAPPNVLRAESLEEFRGNQEDASMEETLGSLKESEEREMSDLKSNQDGSLTISLKGSMSLKLKYETEGREVSVAFEGRFLKVALSDGTEFKIPVGESHARKAA